MLSRFKGQATDQYIGVEMVDCLSIFPPYIKRHACMGSSINHAPIFRLALFVSQLY